MATKRAVEPLQERSSMLHVRVGDALKEQAAMTLGEIGLTTSEAIRLFLHRVFVEKRLPLDLGVPNAMSREAVDGDANQSLHHTRRAVRRS